MSNVRYLESMLDHHWPEMHRNFPAIEKPVLIPARAIRGAAPMYMRRYIDQDENSFYMFVKADPRNGDASREMAKQFFDDLLYNKLGGQSSYDMDSGMTPENGDPLFGTMTREEAISKEVLPAQDDRNYQQYYDEQMNQMQGDADNSEETKDDSDIIDIDDEGNIIEPGNRAVAKTQGTAVGLVKPIWYAIDLHIPAGGAQLGYSGAGRLGRGGSRRLLRNSETLEEAESIQTLISVSKLDPSQVAQVFEIRRKNGTEFLPNQDTYGIRTKDGDVAIIARINGNLRQDGFPTKKVGNAVVTTKEAYDTLFPQYDKLYGIEEVPLQDKITISDKPEVLDSEDELAESEIEFNESIMNKFRNYFN